jgi:GTP-binding protein
MLKKSILQQANTPIRQQQQQKAYLCTPFRKCSRIVIVMNNIVAIVGRPNVGKSTLYNRLIGEREAIVDDFSGVTRDRMYGSCDWNGKTFTVIDTGGFVKNSDDVFEVAIRNQVEIAIDEADLIILMVDVTTGITDLDELRI